MTDLLWRSELRSVSRHPWQVGLAVLGIALGVAVVLAVHLATESARRAFGLSMASVAGRATHQIVGGPSGLTERVYASLRLDLRLRSSAPVVEGYLGAGGRTLRLLGIDPLAEGPFRGFAREAGSEHSSALRSLLTVPLGVLIAPDLASDLRLGKGGVLEATVEGRALQLRVAGFLHPHDALEARAMAQLLVADIATAQQVLGMIGRLSRIDLALDAEDTTTIGRLQRWLPPGAELRSPATRTRALTEMTRAFGINLTAMSLLALVVGMFLIYSTMSFSVVQRRPILGRLRALGVTRRQIFLLVLSEAGIIGLLGSALGAGLGIALAGSLVGLVIRTIGDLYFTLTVGGLFLTPRDVLVGMAVGLTATVLAAWAPAVDATRTPPLAVLSRSTLETRLRLRIPKLSGLAVSLLAAGALLLVPPDHRLVLSFAALFVIILGCVLLTPAATLGLMRLLRPTMGALLGLLGNLSVRGVEATLGRTAVTLAALMIAIATTVGVGIMVGSFRLTVASWLQSRLQADIYLSPTTSSNEAHTPDLDPGLASRLLRELPEIAHISTYRGAEVDSLLGPTRLAVIDPAPTTWRGYRLKEGEPRHAWEALSRGAVLVSEPYAAHHDLHLGARLTLRTDRGKRDFAVAGVYYDYGSDRGVVTLERGVYERYWEDRGVTGLGLYLRPGVDVDRMLARLQALGGDSQRLSIHSNRGLREASLQVFDRTFAITGVLRALCVLVAFVGVLSSLMALQLEKAREYAVLRAIGLSPRQLWGLVSGQTALLGFTAGLLAMPVGAVLSVLLIYVINRRAFGWTLELNLLPEVFGQGLMLGLVAALLAGMYPAWKMARSTPAAALHEE